MAETAAQRTTRKIALALAPLLSDAVQNPESRVVQDRIRRRLDEIVAEVDADAGRQIAAAAAANTARMERMRQNNADLVAQTREEDRRQYEQQKAADAQAAQTAQDQAVADARAQEQAKCEMERQQAAQAAQIALANAVAAARADEKAIAATDKANAVAAARSQEQAACATLRSQDAAAALADKNAAVAAARTDEQGKCTTLRAADATTAAAAQATAVAAAKTSERAKIVQEIQVAPVTGITITLLGNVRQQIKTYVQNGPYA